jgi:hypothetical protein
LIQDGRIFRGDLYVVGVEFIGGMEDERNIMPKRGLEPLLPD